MVSQRLGSSATASAASADDRQRLPVEHRARLRANRHHPAEHVLAWLDGRSEVEQLQDLSRRQVRTRIGRVRSGST